MIPGNGLKILAWISIIILLIIAVYISRLLMGTVALSILLTYMLYPIYKLAFAKTQSERRSSQIAILAVLIASALVLLVFYFIISQGFAGISSDLTATKNINTANLWTDLGILPDLSYSPEKVDVKKVIHSGIIPFMSSFIIQAVIQEVTKSWVLPILQSKIPDFTIAFPLILIQLIVATFLAYFFLLNGKGAALKSTDLLHEEQRLIGRHFLKELDGVFKTLLTVNFDIAAYNFLVGIVIFSLIGVPFSAVWAILASFLSLTRFFGPWLIFVPLSVFLFLTNDFSKGFLLLFFGIALLEYVPEYILRPRISEGSSPVNIALAFLSYVAPILVLGPMGIIIGPFVYGLLIAAYRTAQQYSGKRDA